MPFSHLTVKYSCSYPARMAYPEMLAALHEESSAYSQASSTMVP